MDEEEARTALDSAKEFLEKIKIFTSKGNDSNSHQARTVTLEDNN